MAPCLGGLAKSSSCGREAVRRACDVEMTLGPITGAASNKSGATQKLYPVKPKYFNNISARSALARLTSSVTLCIIWWLLPFNYSCW